MIRQHVIPSLRSAKVDEASTALFDATIYYLDRGVSSLKDEIAAIHAAKTDAEKAALARTMRLETMITVRESCDEAEAICPANLWTLATYKELQFLDQHVE